MPNGLNTACSKCFAGSVSDSSGTLKLLNTFSTSASYDYRRFLILNGINVGPLAKTIMLYMLPSLEVGSGLARYTAILPKCIYIIMLHGAPIVLLVFGSFTDANWTH